MARVRGRTDDMVVMHGRKFVPDDVAAVISQVEGLGAGFKIVVDRVEGEDTMGVEVELSSVLPEDTISSIEKIDRALGERLLRAFGFEVSVKIAEPRSLSGQGDKARVVEDRRDM